jgi:hypothetical protein
LGGLISADGNTVTFTAPPGDALNPGDFFFTNVIFSGALPDDHVVTFTGAFDPVPAPEPSSLILLSLGAAALAGWQSWRKTQPA